MEKYQFIGSFTEIKISSVDRFNGLPDCLDQVCSNYGISTSGLSFASGNLIDQDSFAPPKIALHADDSVGPN